MNEFMHSNHRGFVVKYLGHSLYVDGPADVAYTYWRYGRMSIDAVVALSAPAELVVVLLDTAFDTGAGQ